MRILIKFLINAFALYLTALIVPGFNLSGFWTIIIAAAVLGIINVIIRPIMLLITLPINILTLGLFTFVINALMLLLASAVVSGFFIAGFWTAILAAIILSIISTILHMIFEESEDGRRMRPGYQS